MKALQIIGAVLLIIGTITLNSDMFVIPGIIGLLGAVMVFFGEVMKEEGEDN